MTRMRLTVSNSFRVKFGVLRVADEEPAYFAFAGAPEDPELEILVKRTMASARPCSI